MNYKKAYKNIMLKAKAENRSKGGATYYESHHILPNFLFEDRKGRTGPKGHLKGDCDSAENLVLLTIREHVLAHMLLAKIYKDSRYGYSAGKSLLTFFSVMNEDCSHPRAEWYGMSKSKKYEQYRLLAIKAQSDSMIGTMLVKDAITGEKIGRVSTQHERVLSGEWVHWTTGRTISEEESKERSERNSGMSNPNAKPDITKQMIVDAVVKYAIENNKGGNYILRKEMDDALKQELDVSVTIMKQRFTNGRTELLEEVNAKLVKAGLAEVKYDPYYRGEEQKKLLSSASSTHRWATDGVKNVRLNAVDLEKFLKENKTYKQGRTL